MFHFVFSICINQGIVLADPKLLQRLALGSQYCKAKTAKKRKDEVIATCFKLYHAGFEVQDFLDETYSNDREVATVVQHLINAGDGNIIPLHSLFHSCTNYHRHR